MSAPGAPFAPGAAPLPDGRLGLLPGTLIAGRYEVKQLLALGPSGVVHQAHDREVEVDVALKLVAGEWLAGEGDLGRFVEAHRRAIRVAHASLVKLYDAGPADVAPPPGASLEEHRTRADRYQGGAFVSMQLLGGIPLSRVLEVRRARASRFSPKEAAGVLAEVGVALAAAQGLGPHGDLKPANLLVLEAALKVTDHVFYAGFNETTRLRLATNSGVNPYLAPEVRRRGVVVPQSDSYSLACLLLALLQGTDPPPSPEDALLASAQCELQDIHPELVAAVGRALDVSETNRPLPSVFLAEVLPRLDPLRATRLAVAGAVPRGEGRPVSGSGRSARAQGGPGAGAGGIADELKGSGPVPAARIPSGPTRAAAGEPARPEPPRAEAPRADPPRADPVRLVTEAVRQAAAAAASAMAGEALAAGEAAVAAASRSRGLAYDDTADIAGQPEGNTERQSPPRFEESTEDDLLAKALARTASGGTPSPFAGGVPVDDDQPTGEVPSTPLGAPTAQVPALTADMPAALHATEPGLGPLAPPGPAAGAPPMAPAPGLETGEPAAFAEIGVPATHGKRAGTWRAVHTDGGQGAGAAGAPARRRGLPVLVFAVVFVVSLLLGAVLKLRMRSAGPQVVRPGAPAVLPAPAPATPDASLAPAPPPAPPAPSPPAGPTPQ